MPSSLKRVPEGAGDAKVVGSWGARTCFLIALSYELGARSLARDNGSVWR